MCHFVIIQIARSGKSFSTQRTGMGLFTTMNSSVKNFFKNILGIFILYKTTYYFYILFFRLISWHNTCECLKKMRLKILFLQTSQIWGFSPVWVRWCLFSKLGLSKVFAQTRQGNIVLVLALLTLEIMQEFVSKSWAGIIGGLCVFSSDSVVFAEY